MHLNSQSRPAFLRLLTSVLCGMLFLLLSACSAGTESRYGGMTAEEIVSRLTLEQKASQMVQPACYNINDDEMQALCYGSILSQGAHLDAAGWRKYTASFQRAALRSEAGIPYIYGQDDVHGVNYCLGAVYFPHNIGLGAANDEELMYRIGSITADEAKLCHMLWNFAPCVAQSADPRWGRTYESYGSDLETIIKLSTAYSRGLLEGGLVVCPKHFFGDGNTSFGTGESRDLARLIDRGNATLSDEEIEQLLSVYQAQIDAGVQTVMISFSSLNGVKMHENKAYIDLLKNEMGFQGFIVSDWEAVSQTSPSNYYDQVVAVVNAGVDMLMEADHFREARAVIINAVKTGRISEKRIDDAVTRIIRVKMNAGVLEDPLCENLVTAQQATGSAEYRAVAEEAVEKSLVLLKNEGNILPLKKAPVSTFSARRRTMTRPSAADGPLGGTQARSGASPASLPFRKVFCKKRKSMGFGSLPIQPRQTRRTSCCWWSVKKPMRNGTAIQRTWICAEPWDCPETKAPCKRRKAWESRLSPASWPGAMC